MQHKKVLPIPLGDNLSETAGQKTLRDTPVVLKLRRKVAEFFWCLFVAVDTALFAARLQGVP